MKKPKKDIPVDTFTTDPNPGDPGYSSTINHADWDPNLLILRIEFKPHNSLLTPPMYIFNGRLTKPGDERTYPPIEWSQDLWERFKAAGSKGTFFSGMIKPYFKGVRYGQ